MNRILLSGTGILLVASSLVACSSSSSTPSSSSSPVSVSPGTASPGTASRSPFELFPSSPFGTSSLSPFGTSSLSPSDAPVPVSPSDAPAPVSPSDAPVPAPIRPSDAPIPAPSSVSAEGTISPEDLLPDNAKIVLSLSRYGNVAPSQRSTLDITITKEKSTIKIVDKGKTTLKETITTDPKVWEALSFASRNVKNLSSAEKCGVGGPTETLTITSGTKTLSDVTIQGCDGVEIGVGMTPLEIYVTPALMQFSQLPAPIPASSPPTRP